MIEPSYLGRHFLVEYYECDEDVLSDDVFLKEHLEQAVILSDATIIKSVFHKFTPQGASGVVVIAESHFSIHTWPEHRYAAVDFFTCSESMDVTKAFDHVAKSLQSKKIHMKEIKRGLLSNHNHVVVEQD